MEIKRFDPISCGKVTGLLYAMLILVFAVLFIPVALIMAVVAPQQADAPPPAVLVIMALGMAIIGPIAYGLMGFIVGVITAWLYNLTARMVGGVRFEIGEH